MSVNIQSYELENEVDRPIKQTAVYELLAFVAFALISKEIMDYFLVAYSDPFPLITMLLVLTIYIYGQNQN